MVGHLKTLSSQAVLGFGTERMISGYRSIDGYRYYATATANEGAEKAAFTRLNKFARNLLNQEIYVS